MSLHQASISHREEVLMLEQNKTKQKMPERIVRNEVAPDNCT